MSTLGVVFLTKLDPWPGPQKARSYACLICRVIEFVSSYLLLDKQVVRFVLVKGRNDVVTVAPGIRTIEVLFISGGISVARYV